MSKKRICDCCGKYIKDMSKYYAVEIMSVRFQDEGRKDFCSKKCIVEHYSV